MFKIPSFIKINKNRRFEYRPRYYNKNKDTMEKLMKEKNAKRFSEDDFKDRWSYNRKTISKENKSSIIRLVTIIGVLLLISYVILNANLTLVESLLKK